MSTGIWCLKIHISTHSRPSSASKTVFFYSKEDAEKRLKKEEFWFMAEHFEYINQINTITNEKIIKYTNLFEEKCIYEFYNEDLQDFYKPIDLYNGKFDEYYKLKHNLYSFDYPIFYSSVFEVCVQLD
jgi:hypothetical protein